MRRLTLLLLVLSLTLSLSLSLTANPTFAAGTLVNGDVTHEGTTNYGTDTGSANAYVVATSPVTTAYITGATYTFIAANANTGASTVNFGPGIKTIKKATGGVSTDLVANDIRATQPVILQYNGTYMMIQSTLGNAASGSGTVVGPGSATDGVPALFDGTSGALIKNSTPTGTGSTPVMSTAPIIASPSFTTKMNWPRVTSFPGSPVSGDTVVVIDDSALGACDSAGGSAQTLCQYNGSVWVSLGDGATGSGITSLGGLSTTTQTITRGAGIGGTDSASDHSFTTASGEADFLASGALTCGAGTQGKAQVHTTPLQYCDNNTTPTLRYSAYGDSAGKATDSLLLNGATFAAPGAIGGTTPAAGTFTTLKADSFASTSAATATCDGTAGCIELGAGTAPSGAPATSTIRIYSPTSITAYSLIPPSAAGTGLLKWTNSSGTVTESLDTNTYLTAITGGSCTNQFVSSLSTAGAPTCSTVTLAGAQFANQGTTTTILHGNGSGNPSWSGISLTNDATANQGTTTTVLHGNASGQPSWAGISLANDTAANQGTTTTVLHGNGSGQPSFGSIATGDIADNAVTSAKMAVVNTVRQCIIENDTQSATALTDAQITGRCDVPAAAHVYEVAVFASGGTPTLTLERWRPNGGTTADLLSATLATGSSGAYACARATTSATCDSGVTSSSSVTLAGAATVAVAAKDVIRVKAATAGGTATWHHVVVSMTLD
jgi:hypothetical protein